MAPAATTEMAPAATTEMAPAATMPTTTVATASSSVREHGGWRKRQNTGHNQADQ
jgi:hypothetical protein